MLMLLSNSGNKSAHFSGKKHARYADINVSALLSINLSETKLSNDWKLT